MSERTDLVVLGGGNAGLAVAGAARAEGWSVRLIEARDVGGTCPLRGCVPKKVLVAAAEALDLIARAGAHHIHVGDVRLDWPALIQRERGFVEGVAESFAEGLQGKGVDLVYGSAVFVAPDAVEVDGARYEADHFVVATGSSPRKLPIEGWEHTLTSDDLLQMSELPESVLFVGGGVIALEFSHVLQRAGAKVTVLEVQSRILPALDADQVAVLTEHTRDLGVAIETSVRVERIEAVDGGFAVHWSRDGQEHQTRVAAVVNGAGRVANLADLDLGAAGVDWDGRKVLTDGYLRSATNPRVWFAGDALPGTPQLSPVATHEGKVLAHNLLSSEEPKQVDYSAIPSAVFTVPAAAQVGLTEAAAREQGIDVEVKVNRMEGWRTAKTYAESVAWAKVVLERVSGRILGAHLVGHGAQETIHAFASSIAHRETASDVKERVYAYPTFHNDLKFTV